MTRINLVAIRNLVGFINYADQFGPKHLLRIVCRTGVMKHSLSIVSLCNEEQQLLNVFEVRRNRTAFCDVFNDVTTTNVGTLSNDGFVNSVIFHPTLNRCSRDFIRTILREKRYF